MFRRRPNKPIVFNIYSCRLREIERLIGARHGSLFDTDDADVYLRPVCRLRRRIYENKNGKSSFKDIFLSLKDWASVRMPLITEKAIENVVREVMLDSRIETPDQLGIALRLSYVERSAHRITTIGSFDLNKAGRARLRKNKKRIRDRERARQRRRRLGALTRSAYLANSATSKQPWLDEGISRATYYRRRANIDETTASPSKLAIREATDLSHSS